MKAYSIRNGEIFEPEVKEERTNKHRKEKEQECNCNRPYEIELTNEEWFCFLSTEEKAKVITDFIKRIAKAEEIELNINKEAWIRWLREPHRESE